VPDDYLETGQVIYVRPDFNPLAAFDRAGQMQKLLHASLVGGNQELAAVIDQPMNLQVDVLKPTTQRDENNPLTFFIPYGVSMVYYIAILMSASFLLSSVTKEKENRVLEILMASVSPRQLLAGKIIGLGIIGLFQNLLWVGMGYALLRLSGQTFKIPSAFQLPPAVLAWGVVFFLFGYAVYASLMAAVGALVPNLREASQATIVVIAPMMVPLFFISIMIEAPNGALATALSLIPLTSPVTMMLRLAATSVPVWQVALSAVLLAITAFWIIRTVSGLFRAQTLLAGQPFSFRRLVNAVVYGE
jgi:ABC-2 type transport system permease protein